jgi:hypothetical protein
VGDRKDDKSRRRNATENYVKATGTVIVDWRQALLI